MTVRYAAYGSNLHPLRLQLRAPSATLIGTAFVHDHELLFHKKSRDDSGKCNLRPGRSGAYVAVYEMDAADKAVLDAIEGVGAGYESADLLVPKFGRCASYFAAHTHIDDLLQPYDWYRELVLLGCRRLRLPTAYVARVASSPVLPDPQRARRDSNWRLVERLRRDLATLAT